MQKTESADSKPTQQQQHQQKEIQQLKGFVSWSITTLVHSPGEVMC